MALLQLSLPPVEANVTVAAFGLSAYELERAERIRQNGLRLGALRCL